MKTEINIVQQYNNGYVQIEAKQKSGSRYYYLPAKKVKSFGDELIKQNKNYNLNANIALGASALVGVLGASSITKNMSKTVDIAAKFIAAVSLAGITGYLANDMNNKSHDKLLKTYGAKELAFV